MQKLQNIKKIRMFGYEIFSMTLRDSVKLIVEASRNLHSSIVVTPNVDHFVKLRKNQSFREAYDKADMYFADGAPIVLLSKLLPGSSLPERVTGADLFPLLCEECALHGLSIAILGTSDRIAEMAIIKLMAEFSGIQISGHYSPPFGFESSEEENQKIIGLCNEWQPHILFLALGAPKQELWAAKNKSQLHCGVMLCCGAAVDFYSGDIKRAPPVVRKLGMEWLWRLMSDPKRLWRRYLRDDPFFIVMAIVEIFRAWRSQAVRSNL